MVPKAPVPPRRGERPVQTFTPESLDEVAALLLAADGEAPPVLRGGCLRSDRLALEVRRVPELNRLDYDERNGLRAGVAVSLAEFLAFPPARLYPALTDAAACLPPRPEPTLGEALGWMRDGLHLRCGLFCLPASVAVFGPHGWSEIAAEAVFAEAAPPAVQSREFLVDLRLPAPPPYSSGAYQAGDWPGTSAATGGAGVVLAMEPDGKRCCGGRLSFWTVSRPPMRILEVERYLAGKLLDERAAADAGDLADEVWRLGQPGKGSAWEASPRALCRAAIVKTLDRLGRAL